LKGNKAMAVSGSLIQTHAGDAPNITGVEQYLDEIIHACQQRDSKLWNLVPSKSLPINTRTLWIPKMDQIDGSAGYQDTMTSGIVSGVMNDAGADINAFAVSTDRYGFTKNMAMTNTKRQLTGTKYYINPLIPEDDLLSTGWVDIMQATKQTIDYRWNRYRDTVLLTALGAATVLEGEDDTTTGAFPTATVAFAAGGGVTVGGAATLADRDLMEEITYNFEVNEVDLEVERPILVCPPLVKRMLRDADELKNRDYTDKNNVDVTTLEEACGFRIIVTNQITASDGKFRCFAFVPSALRTAEWGQMRIKESYRPDRNDGLQISMKYESGAVRVEDKKVIWVDVKSTWM
jgi:hypothetical protein